MSTPRPRLRITAHALLIDSSGRVLLIRTETGTWALPSTVLTFEVQPYRQTIAFLRQVLGIEAAERDLLLAHVSAHRSVTGLAGLGLVVSVGHWLSQPAPTRTSATDAPTRQPTRQWCAPGQPPAPLAAWDAAVLPALLTNTPYAEIGWNPRPTPGPARTPS
ncbi:hypothetical protein [Frankia gtarii]|uniref:hypothetical protein n=1 Tax=Frankia gtarii TaxID=2950102 RepID=UPI0021C21249|nr:hypothetical protein [Frankia gtarii]